MLRLSNEAADKGLSKESKKAMDDISKKKFELWTVYTLEYLKLSNNHQLKISADISSYIIFILCD